MGEGERRDLYLNVYRRVLEKRESNPRTFRHVSILRIFVVSELFLIPCEIGPDTPFPVFFIHIFGAKD